MKKHACRCPICAPGTDLDIAKSTYVSFHKVLDNPVRQVQCFCKQHRESEQIEASSYRATANVSTGGLLVNLRGKSLWNLAVTLKTEQCFWSTKKLRRNHEVPYY